MITLKEYEIYLKVKKFKKFIETIGCDENERIQNGGSGANALFEPQCTRIRRQIHKKINMHIPGQITS